MAATEPPRVSRSCAVEIYVAGLIYIRLERVPRRLLRVALTVASIAAGWLAARYPGLLPR